MRSILPFLCSSLLVAQTPAPMQAVTAATPVDNAWVKVRHLTIAPGQAIPLHEHPESVLIALTKMSYEETLEGQKPHVVALKAGEAVHYAPLKHAIKGLAEEPMEAVLVEFKPGGPATKGQDATGATDDAKHAKVVFSSDRVRVIRWIIEGKGTSTHGHGNHVTLFLSAGKASLKAEGGAAKEISTKAGDVLWTEALRHTVVNLGSAPIEAISVELRPKGK